MYHFFLATPERVVFDDDIFSLIAPGSAGYLEILTNHAPIMVALTLGELTITNKNNIKMFFSISGGYLEMSKNKAIVLADTIELASEINLKRAETALHKAHERLELKDSSIDILRAKQAMRRAENRIKIFRARV